MHGCRRSTPLCCSAAVRHSCYVSGSLRACRWSWPAGSRRYRGHGTVSTGCCALLPGHRSVCLCSAASGGHGRSIRKASRPVALACGSSHRPVVHCYRTTMHRSRARRTRRWHISSSVDELRGRRRHIPSAPACSRAAGNRSPQGSTAGLPRCSPSTWRAWHVRSRQVPWGRDSTGDPSSCSPNPVASSSSPVRSCR